MDNAATTMRKPKEVTDAVVAAMNSMGNAGRGAHAASLGASRTIYDTREALARFFGAESPKQIVFTNKDFFVDTQDEYQIEWIVPNAQKNEMEPILLTLPPKGTSQTMDSHFGEEFGYVLKGNVTLVRDNKKYKLKAKDTFYMNGRISHYLYNHGNSEALVLWVTNPPMF